MTTSTQRTVEFEVHGLRLVADRWDPPARASTEGVALLLHGGGQTRHSWRRTGERLASSGWVAVCLDSRGHGDSDWAPDGDYSIEALVADVTAVVEALPVLPVLVGASMGGMTALVGQGERGTLARGLVLVDITPRIEPAGAKRIREFMSSAPTGFASIEEVADAIAAYNPHRPRSISLDGLRKNVRLRADGRWHWHWDPRLLLDLDDEPSRAISPERALAAAGRITVPTLLVRGRQSDVVSRGGAEELLALIPGARLEEVRAGHMVAGDDNDVFTLRLTDFLSTLPVQEAA